MPREEADRNVRLLMAAYDRDRSYELRELALLFEQAGDFDSALDHVQVRPPSKTLMLMLLFTAASLPNCQAVLY